MVAAVVVALMAIVAGWSPPPAAAAVSGDVCGTSTAPAGYTVTTCLTASAVPLTGSAPIGGAVETSVASARVASLVFTVDGSYLITDYEAPYAFQWPTEQAPDGTHTLSVVAVLRDGFQSQPVERTVSTDNGNGGSVPEPPTGFQPTDGTAPSPGSPFVLAALGDAAGGEIGATRVATLVDSWNPNLVTYLGDVYAKGTYTEFVNWYGRAGSLFSAFAERTNPVVGNHEYSADPEAAGYFRYWRGVPHHYDYQAVGWHFYALDSTSQFGQTDAGSPQYEWLKNRLEQAPAGECSVLYFHHPLFNIGNQGPATRMQAIYDLAEAHHISLVLAGHDHTYQRWMPMGAQGNVLPTGFTQIVTGNGGHSSMNVARGDERVAAWSKSFGAVRAELHPDRADIAFYIADGSPSGRIADTAHVPCQGQPPDTTAPGAPGSVAAVASRPSGQAAPQVNLSWSAASDDRGVAEYRVLRGGVEAATLPASATAWTDVDVRESSTYEYAVVAVDAWGNRSTGAGAPAVTTPDPVPVTVTATATQDTYIKDGSDQKFGSATTLRVSAAVPKLTTFLKFSLTGLQPEIRSARLRILANSSGSKGLEVRSVTGAWDEGTLNGTNAQSLVVGGSSIAAVPSVVPGWIDINVTPAVTGNGVISLALTTLGTTQQSYAARESGSPASLVVDSAPLPDTAPPSVPPGLQATVVDSTTVRLDWTRSTDPSGIEKYVIYRDGARLAQTSASSTSYLDPTPNTGQHYDYTVSAVDSVGNESAPSGGASAVVPDLTAPEEPETVLGLATSSISTRVIWAPAEDNVGTTGYTIRRDGVVVGATTGLLFEDTGLTGGTTYAYTVAAEDAAGNQSLPSTAIEVTTPSQTDDTDPPPTPTDVVITTGPQAGQAIIGWTASAAADVSSYQVYRNGFPVSPALAAAATNWTDTGLASATTYGYQVEATDAAGNRSALSPSVSYTTPDVQPPTVPTNVAVSLSGLVATLSWTAATDDVAVDHYEIHRDGVVAAAPVSELSWSDQGLAASSSYSYRVVAVDTSGNRSAASLAVTTQTPSPVTQTLLAAEDAYVSDSAPTMNYGALTTLRVDDLQPAQQSYIRFSGSISQPQVTKAVLRVFANATAAKGAAVYAVPASSTWAEMQVKWNNRPPLGDLIGTAQATPAGGGWIQLDVTPYVQAGTPVAFGLTLPPTGVTAVAFSSREGANKPQLVVTSTY
jgi:chitodextrinase